MKFHLLALLLAGCLGGACDSNPTPHPGQNTTGRGDAKSDASAGFESDDAAGEPDRDDDSPDPAVPSDGLGDACDENGAMADAVGGDAIDAIDAGDATPEDGRDDDNETRSDGDCATPSAGYDNDNVVERSGTGSSAED